MELQRKQTLHRKGIWGVVAVMVVTLSGCSSEADREYALPESLCGTPVVSDLLSPLLPAGKKVSIQSASPLDGIERCKVSVDGEIALVASQEWWDEESRATPQKVASAHARLKLDHISDDGKYVYSKYGSAWKVDCVKPTRADSELFAVVQMLGAGKLDADAVKDLISAFAQAVSSSDQCTSGRG